MPSPGSWTLTEFAGEFPIKDDRLLADPQAVEAWNLNLNEGNLMGLPALKPLRVIGNIGAVPAKRAYRLPGPGVDDPDAWLALPSPYSSVVRSPLADDTLHRIYWTNPGEGAFWNTYDRIYNGLPEYDLGTINPSDGTVTTAPTVVQVGGTTDGTIPYIARSYVWVYINQYGEESQPSLPSTVVNGPPDATWVISNLPRTQPRQPTGRNYPLITGVLLYRTTTGATSGGQFYLNQVWDYSVNPPPGSYTDVTPDDIVTANPVLFSTSFANPPANLDGLTSLGNGMLVGFTGSTLHFCEPNRPYAWPASYDISARYDIVGMDVWQNQLVILTKGYPSTGGGTSPSAFALQTVHVGEPCIARGSILADLLGVYYASPNGLVMLNYYGMTNQTQAIASRNQWRGQYQADQIIACRYRSQYLALTGKGTGFSIDFGNNSGFVNINTFLNAVCVWGDVYSGDAYVMADGIVYLYGDPTTQQIIYRWRSKRWLLPAPVSLGAVQVIAGQEILDDIPNTAVLDNLDPLLTMPDGVNLIFRLYTDEGLLAVEAVLTEVTSIFHIPGGFKSFDWQIEILSRVPVFRIEVARTKKDLRSV